MPFTLNHPDFTRFLSPEQIKNYEQNYNNSPYGKISELDPTVKNRFDDYEDLFSYSDQSKFLDEIFGQSEQQINRQAGEDIADLQGGAAGRLASRGITGGSVVDDTLSGIGTDINKGKFNALSQLKTGKAQGKLGLMGAANERKFATTGAASNIDMQNFLNQMRQLGLLSDIDFKNQYLQLQRDNQPGFLEDFFSVIEDIGGLATGAGELGWKPFKK